MKTKKLFVTLFTFSLALTGCNNGGNPSSSAEGGSSAGGTSASGEPASATSSNTSAAPSSSSAPSQSAHTEEEVTEYMNDLKAKSAANHFYLHYYRYAQSVEDYNKWDVWSWPYKPKPGEGYRFDWNGRTTNADHPEQDASGNAIIDSLGYVTCDIDLTKEYNGGWNNTKKTIGGETTSFYQLDGETLDEQIGIQIVESSTRKSGSSFWANDSGNVYIKLADYAINNTQGGQSYHVFVAQDRVKEPTTLPPTSNVDPFEGDDGTNVTFGDDRYANVNFGENIPVQKTSKLFLKGDTSKSYLKYGAGVGYQIMVSSFADSDGDGSGDILGIKQKLPYLKDLGVNVLWLTPIQLSDSYHGYDISDYTQVDPKFGSTASPHVSNGVVTSDSAMEDYKDLIAAAHQNGMAIVMDLVLNHTSPTNNWFIKSAQLNADYRGFYQWGNHVTDTTGKIVEEKCWYPYGDHVYSYYAKFGSAMPELNYAYVPTRTAVATMAKQWCEIGVDGFRMDAVKHIFMNDEVKQDQGDKIVEDVTPKADYSSNLTKNLHFWKYLNKEVKSAYPNCFFVAENFDGDARNVAPFYQGFDSCFDFLSYFNLTSVAAKASGNPNASTITGANASSAIGYLKDAGTWSQTNWLNEYSKERGGGNAYDGESDNAPINGQFTSNHDIARTINRIAGTTMKMDKSGRSSDGIEQQGNVTTASDYAKYNKYALLTQIVQVLLPGCTWIYYGDELGMTGNFPAKDADGKDFTSESAYADLYYRQPMKWKQGGIVGDGSMTTGYAVTGSGMDVKWDSMNASSTVPDATAQKADANSHFSVLSKFVKLKASTPALIRGSLEAYDWGENKFVFNFHRKLAGKDYWVVVNMGSSEIGFDSTGYTLDAAYKANFSTKKVEAGGVFVAHK